MNETPDTPDASELSDMDNSEELELASSEELDDSAEAEEENEESSDLSFALLALALLIMVGASVYFVGVLLGSDEDTAAAQERANAQIEGFEAPPITIDGPPSTLPLVDDGPLPADSNVADVDVEEEEEEEPEFDETQAPSPNVDPADIGIAFVNRTPGEDYGKVAYLNRSGERIQTELECERLDLNENGGICLDADNGLGGGGRGLILDAGLNPTTRFGINLPSRAAASPDGEVVAWTGFAVGHSYLQAGEFATTTQLIEVERGIGANLETGFATFDINGEAVNDETRNFWGVTFVDNDRFYATLGIGEDTSIVQGTISTSRLQVIHENATCPEISPDGSTIVAKERREGDHFQVIAIDVETGERRDIAETRSVEDQVEFLDNDTIIYGLPNETEGTEAQPAWDVWALDLNGGTPQLIIPFADSPAAI